MLHGQTVTKLAHSYLLGVIRTNSNTFSLESIIVCYKEWTVTDFARSQLKVVTRTNSHNFSSESVIRSYKNKWSQILLIVR